MTFLDIRQRAWPLSVCLVKHRTPEQRRETFQGSKDDVQTAKN